MEEDHPKNGHGTVATVEGNKYGGGLKDGKYYGQVTQSAVRRSRLWIATI